ncbi:MAG TPA: hypothetical protein VE242_13640, partial [Chthoniobacterales bacterium]|nr:hypothetical protein [Chthoniobacterales bacterium]
RSELKGSWQSPICEMAQARRERLKDMVRDWRAGAFVLPTLHHVVASQDLTSTSVPVCAPEQNTVRVLHCNCYFLG